MSNSSLNHYEEKAAKSCSGMLAMIFITLAFLVFVAVLVYGSILIYRNNEYLTLGIIMLVTACVYITFIGWVPYMGLKILKPNEALVLTLFGKYYGTIKKEGFYYVNPFVMAVNPAAGTTSTTSGNLSQQKTAVTLGGVNLQSSSLPSLTSKKISLKVITMNNDTQKINDQMGNPIIIGIVVVWKVINPTKAVFNVDNYKEFLSIQCDSALRNIVRLYPYDTYGDDNEKTLRGSSQEISMKLRDEIQQKVEIAGLNVEEARITHLAYAPEIAAAMLQRQQASAIIDARQMIVDGAVGMVEMALKKLSAGNIVDLDEERKAAMVSNLLVVLCGNRDAQPVVNSGSLQ